MQSNECSFPGCVSPKKATRRFCSAHVQEYAKSGMSSLRSPEDRFLEKVDSRPVDACWEWLGHITRDGYGTFRFGGKTITAQRASYQLYVGPIDLDMEIDHLCRNRSCVNPKHLEMVTHSENTRRAALAQTHCVNGHEFTPENVYNNHGHRGCRRCSTVQVPCPVCGQLRSKGNMLSHKKLMHKI